VEDRRSEDAVAAAVPVGAAEAVVLGVANDGERVQAAPEAVVGVDAVEEAAAALIVEVADVSVDAADNASVVEVQEGVGGVDVTRTDDQCQAGRQEQQHRCDVLDVVVVEDVVLDVVVALEKDVDRKVSLHGDPL
jgi:hypothetical protein